MRTLDLPLLEGEHRPIRLDAAYGLTAGELPGALDELTKRRPPPRLLPLGGRSSGGVWQNRAADATIIGLQLTTPAQPRVRLAEHLRLDTLELDEIVIDRERRRLATGAAVTLTQLNAAVAEHLGESFQVLGGDLTSADYAQAGATFMTGGMGPQRRYFSDGVEAVRLHDGLRWRNIQQPEAADYAGSYGWSGLVSGLICRIIEWPPHELALALPLPADAEPLADYLAHLLPLAELETDADRRVVNAAGRPLLLLGVEHMSRQALAPLAEEDGPWAARAEQLLAQCRAAGHDGIGFMHLRSHLKPDECLAALLDPDGEHIGGLDITHAQQFPDAETMRMLREAVPYSWRHMTPSGRFLHKSHSDVNLRLPQDNPAAAMRRIWRAHMAYVAHMEEYFAQRSGGRVAVYGHLNPIGIDPHNRITFACDDRKTYARTVDEIRAAQTALVCELAAICSDTGAQFTGAEKAAASEAEMFAAFGGPHLSPPPVAQRFLRHCARIGAAAPCFNWRAPPPYHPDA